MSPEPQLPGRGAALPLWIRQFLACGLVFLLSARIPGQLMAWIASLRNPASWSAAGEPLLLLVVDAFGLLCALFFTHRRIRGLALLRCYPPNRLIPLSCHLIGLLFGLISLGNQL